MAISTSKATISRAGLGFHGRMDPVLAAILLLGLVLNLWGVSSISWWHPDETTPAAVQMLRERQLVPPLLAYGSLHYYQLMAFVLPFGVVAKLFVADPEMQRSIVMFAGRLLSAVLGAGCAAGAFVLGRALFDRRVGLLAALITTLSAGIVILSHFATTAVPASFWFTASMAMSALYLSRGRAHQLVIAGLFAGLAAATKYVGGVVLLGALAAFLLHAEQPRRLARLGASLSAAALAFVVANPGIVLSSCEFLQGFVVENRYNQLRGAGGSLAFVPLLRDLVVGMGWGAVAAVAAGLVLALGSIAKKGQEWRALTLLLLPAAAYYALLGSHHWSGVRYDLPLIPLLAVLAAKLFADLTSPTRPALVQRGAIAALAVVLLWSGATTVGALLQLRNDPRLLARAWIVDHVPAGSTIETTPYGPRLPKDRYQVAEQPFSRGSAEIMARFENDPLHQRLESLLAAYFDVAEAVGACDGQRPYYRSWVKRTQERYAETSRSFGHSLADLEARSPDFLVISSFYYRRFEDDPRSPEYQMFKALRDGRSPFQEVARFHYSATRWPAVEWACCTLNPELIVFQRRPPKAPPA